jgi:hypothetical protein
MKTKFLSFHFLSAHMFPVKSLSIETKTNMFNTTLEKHFDQIKDMPKDFPIVITFGENGKINTSTCEAVQNVITVVCNVTYNTLEIVLPEMLMLMPSKIDHIRDVKKMFLDKWSDKKADDWSFVCVYPFEIAHNIPPEEYALLEACHDLSFYNIQIIL